jgi:hypothetical protein
MLSERSCCASTGSVEPRRKRRADAAKHPRQTPAAAPWTPRNRTAAAVLTGLPPGPALLPATPSGAPCWAAAQACPHPRAEIPRRCAAATATNAAAAASMEEPALTGARRRGAPQTRRSSRLLSCGITGARRRRAPGARGSSRLQRGLRSGRATRGRLWNASCAAFASPLAPAPYRAGHIRSGALRRLGTARRRPASHLRVQRRAAHTLHRLPFTSSCWTRWKPAAAHRARRQAHGDAPPPHGSLIALTFARGGVALRLAACSRSLAGRLPGPARKARGRRPRLPGRLPRTLLGRRSHRSRCLPAESVCGSCALCHFVARV